MTTRIDATTLENRIKAAKRFLNSELTQLRLRSGDAQLTLNEVTHIKDGLHEIERVGLRHLTDMHHIKVTRLLTSVEARMKLPRN